MSLINQMLQELEQRKTAAPPLATTMPQMYTVGRSSPKKYILPLALLLVCLATYAAANLPKPFLTKVTHLFALPGSTTLINDANAAAKREVATMATQAIPLPVRSSLVFDAQLSDWSTLATTNMQLVNPTPKVTQYEAPMQYAPNNAQVTLISPSVPNTGVLAHAPSSSELIDAPAAKVEVDSPLNEAPATLQPTTQSTLLPNQTNKASFSKRMSPAQQVAHDYQQAIAYLQQGRVAESMDLLRKALLSMPEHDDARQTLVWLLVDNRHHEEAIDVLKAGLKLSLAQPAMAQTLARLQLEAGQTVAALETLEASLPYAKQQADYHALTAMVLQRLDRQQDAISHYQQALVLGGQTPAWLVGLGVALQTQGRADEAKQVYQQAQRSDLTIELAQFVDQRLKQVSQTMQ
jgi:MSHA biogenesis protein MshN